MKFADIKVGTTVILKEKYPCKLVQVNWSKPGKHGDAKKMVVGLDILTGKKHIDIFIPSSVFKNIEIMQKYYEVSYVDPEGYLHLIDEQGKCREDINVVGDICENIEEGLDNDKKIEITLMTVVIDEKINYKVILKS